MQDTTVPKRQYTDEFTHQSVIKRTNLGPMPFDIYPTRHETRRTQIGPQHAGRNSGSGGATHERRRASWRGSRIAGDASFVGLQVPGDDQRDAGADCERCVRAKARGDRASLPPHKNATCFAGSMANAPTSTVFTSDCGCAKSCKNWCWGTLKLPCCWRATGALGRYSGES